MANPESGDLWQAMAELEAPRCFLWSDPPSGLRAVAVVDDVTLGPAAGGIRTRGYPGLAEAFDDAAALARAMTRKCALAGLDAGGCKIVVLDHPALDRSRAFAELGKRIEELGGLIRTAGDFGTREDDLEAAAAHCRFIHLGEGSLARSVARGVRRCVEACVRQRRGGDGSLEGLTVAIQGCGSIGSAIATSLSEAGAALRLADLDEARAARLAAALGAETAPAADVLGLEVDVLVPSAVGGVVTAERVDVMEAWALVPAANNVLADDALAERLRQRGVLFVPDIIASAGAVVDGIGRTVMGLEDRRPLIDRLGDTAAEVLARSEREARSCSAIARALAEERIQQAHSSTRSPADKSP